MASNLSTINAFTTKNLTGLTLAVLLLLMGCDSTPRERQAVAKEGLKELDTLATTGRRKLTRVGKAAARYDAANRARRATPLDPRQEIRMEATLLGPYADHLAELTPATVADAYQELLQSTRAHHKQWTERDWDYARAIYQRLNGELKRVRLDLPARDELRIRAWQTEFVALQAKRVVKGRGCHPRANCPGKAKNSPPFLRRGTPTRSVGWGGCARCPDSIYALIFMATKAVSNPMRFYQGGVGAQSC